MTAPRTPLPPTRITWGESVRFVNTLLLFGGYLLVYASVANHGKFATEPWNGIFTDAYPMTVGQGVAGAQQAPQPSQPGQGGSAQQRRGRSRGRTTPGTGTIF